MAKSVLRNAMNSLVTVITGLDTSIELKKQLEDLANEISRIEVDDVVLPLHDLKVRKWLEQLLSFLNDFHVLAEELLAVEISQSKGTRIPGSRSFSVDKIKERLVFLVAHKPEHTNSITNTKFDEQEQASLIGREEEENTITRRLSSIADRIDVLPIVGIGGSGKTALANHVSKNINQLKIRVENWGSVFDSKSILKSVIERLSIAEDPEMETEDQMQRHLYEAIGGNRYLLVLDDVKSVDPKEWRKFVKLLPSNGSILITTPSPLVAKSTATVPPVYLEGLSPHHSWSLFKQIVSSSAETQSELRNEDTWRKMVEKCKGVPRAIQIVGSLWKTFRESHVNIESIEEHFLGELERLYCNQLAFPLKLCFSLCSLFSEDDGNRIDVPKLINLWIAEGFVLPRLSSTNNTLEYEAMGEEYFRDLYGRSIFQDLHEDDLDNPSSCRMHPLMHYLAAFMAKDDSTSVDPAGKGVIPTLRHASFDFSLDISTEIPESLFETATELRTILLPAAKQSWHPTETKMSPATCEKIFAKFKSLLVLDLHDLGMKMVPNSISELSLLKYLDLSRNNMEKLPNSITKLKHLLTLRLSHCRELKELPKDLDQLTKLRHLETHGCLDLILMPESIKNMTSLRTLSMFVANSSSDNRKSSSLIRRASLGQSSSRRSSPTSAYTGCLKELANLNNLRGLLEIGHLERCAASDAETANLHKKLQLQRLVLRWDHDDDNVANTSQEKKFLENIFPLSDLKALFLVGYGGTTVSHWPTWPSLQHLVKFSWYNCFNCQSLPPLHKLQSLQILELQQLNALEFIVDNSESGSSDKEVVYRCLKKLAISDCPKLVSWWANVTTLDNSTFKSFFPTISIIDIQYCPMLTCMPPFGEVDERIIWKGSSVKPILNTINKLPSLLADSPPPFSKLKFLKITKMIEEDAVLPKEWLKNFTSLKHLHVGEWHQLESIADGFQPLISLEELIIEDCEKLDETTDSKDGWGGLTNLRNLTIRGIPKLEHLPEGLDCATSLEILEISDCHELASLPVGLKFITSLHTLIIKDCPKLTPRCQPDTGDDWPQIKHIKNRIIW